jgi:hypothetical protein
MTAQMEKEQHVVRDQPTPGPHLGGKKISRDPHVHMHADELVPCRGLLALRSRWNAMALEDVADRLVADRVSQVGQCPDDPILAPGAILLG